MKTSRIVLISVMVLIIAVTAYGGFMIYKNSPIKTVERILILRNNLDKNKDQLRYYMTKSYDEAEKGEKTGINSPQCQLSNLKNEGRVAVLCKIQTVTGDTDAAIFYLVRTGLFPFGYRYQIEDVKIINPNLAEIFSDITPKKKVEEHQIDKWFAEGGWEFMIYDYNCKQESVEDETGEVIVRANHIFKIINKNANAKDSGSDAIYYSFLSSDGLFTPASNISEKIGDHEEKVVLSDFGGSCGKGFIYMQSGIFEKDHKIIIE